MHMKNNKGHSISLLTMVTEAGSLGISLTACILAGVFAGRYVDMYLDTSPWGIMFFSFLGVIAGFWTLYKRMKAFMKEDADRHDESLKKSGNKG